MPSCRFINLCIFSFLFIQQTCAREVIIQNTTLLSAHLEQPLKHQNIHIIDERIAKISAQAITASGPDVLYIDGKDKFVTPGIMDSHVHVGSIPGIGFVASKLATEKPELVAAYFQQQPLSYLYHGVTQVMNLGSSAGSEEFTQAPLRPDYYTCQPIPTVGGYPDLDARFTLQNADYFVLEEGSIIPEDINIDSAAYSPEAVVERITKTGASCIKLYVEDGFGAASSWPMLSDSTLKRIVTAANHHGIKVIAHANAIDMYQIALRANVDVLSHGLWNWQWPADKGDPPVASTLDQVMSSEIAYMPTIQVMQALAELFTTNTAMDDARAKVLPANLLSWYKEDEAQWFKQELRADFSASSSDHEIYQLLNAGKNRAMQSTGYLVSRGYPVLLASDFPSSPSLAAAPGLATLHELHNLSEAGLTNVEIFNAATFNGPSEFGLLKDYGTIETGKVANLLLLDKNPYEQVDAWDTIDQVILRGEVLRRQNLAAH